MEGDGDGGVVVGSNVEMFITCIVVEGVGAIEGKFVLIEFVGLLVITKEGSVDWELLVVGDTLGIFEGLNEFKIVGVSVEGRIVGIQEGLTVGGSLDRDGGVVGE